MLLRILQKRNQHCLTPRFGVSRWKLVCWAHIEQDPWACVMSMGRNELNTIFWMWQASYSFLKAFLIFFLHQSAWQDHALVSGALKGYDFLYFTNILSGFSISIGHWILFIDSSRWNIRHRSSKKCCPPSHLWHRKLSKYKKSCVIYMCHCFTGTTPLKMICHVDAILSQWIS